VRLDQELLTLMEDEGRWAVRNKLAEAEKIPDYSTFLYAGGLKKIKPEAVGVSQVGFPYIVTQPLKGGRGWG
jgi:NitT/TauT family transport system substrate-binding protein